MTDVAAGFGSAGPVAAGSLQLTRLRPLLSVLVPWFLPAAIALLWVAAVRQGWMSPQILPAPSLVAETAVDLAGNDLLQNIIASLTRLFLGLVPGVVAGLAIGVLIGLNQRAERLIYPVFALWSQVPNLALIPLLMVFLGIGDALKIAIIFNAALVPMLINTQGGVRDVPPQLREAAAVLRLGFFQRLRLLTLPGSLPALLTGFRLALSSSWTALVVVELLASSEGIGYLMVWGRQMFQLDIVFVCIFVIGLCGAGFEWLVQQLDRRLVLWPRPAVARHPAVAKDLRGLTLSLVIPALLAALWLYATRPGGLDALLLPSPAYVWAALVTGFTDGTLSEAMAASLRRYGAGLAIGVGIGFLTGLTLGLSAPAGRAVGPTLGVLRHVVIFAWLPLLTAWAGTGEGARILFIAIASFFPASVGTHRAVANLSQPLNEAARVLRLTFLQRLRHVVLPGAATGILGGLRLSIMFGWLATIGAEYFMASSIGIGSLMINAQQLMSTDRIFAGLILVSLTGAAFNFGSRALEYRLQRWRHG